MAAFKKNQPLSCAECSNGQGLGFDFTMAFQPIVNMASGHTYAHEALVRGLGGESAASILGQVNDDNRYRFDQACRVKPISLAAKLGMEAYLSINFLPNAIYRPENCIRTTLEAASEHNFATNRIIFEVTEAEQVEPAHLREILDYYRGQGFLTAIDDFGAGYAGLGLLCDFKPDLVKIDMKLIRDIDKDVRRKTIVKGIIAVCRDLDIQVIAEGVETYEEMSVMRGFGVYLFQGYYFAKPAFQSLADVPKGLFVKA